jgi:hypothetical protein
MEKEVIGIAMTAVYELRSVFRTVNDLGMAGNFLLRGAKRGKWQGKVDLAINIQYWREYSNMARKPEVWREKI